MDWDDFGDWVLWSVLAFAFLATVAVPVTFLAVGARHAIRYLWACFINRPRGRGRGGNGIKTPPLFIDELLQSISDVAYCYKELPPGPAAGVDDDDDDERESCAICVTPYEAGEPCSVLPGCAHMFYKPCVAKWLREKNTCPLCRANVVVVPVVPPRRQPNNNLNAAENMV